MLRAKVVEKVKKKTHFMFDIFSRKSYCLRDVEKWCRAGQATDDTMAYAHCILDTEDYKHILRIRNTYCCPSLQWLQERASMLHYNTFPNLFSFRLLSVVHAVANVNADTLDCDAAAWTGEIGK
jgi:hypothetical protein